MPLALNSQGDMKNTIKLFFVIAVFPTTGFSFTKDLAGKCSMFGGDLIHQWICPQSGKVRNEDHCLVYDAYSNPMVFNGCSGSFGNYGEVFFQACVYHDFCYHHEPTSNGYSKEDCDSKFLLDMMDICKYEQADDHDCEGSAKWFYRAVDFFGGSSWDCSKQPASYPHNHL